MLRLHPLAITRDPFRDLISRCDDAKLQYLEKFAKFVENWSSSGLPGLSKETSLLFSCYAHFFGCCAVARYLLSDLGFSYSWRNFSQIF